MAAKIDHARSSALIDLAWFGIGDNGHFKVGQSLDVEALIDLPNELTPEELKVELYHGRLSGTGELESATPMLMKHTRQMAPGRHLFTRCRMP